MNLRQLAAMFVAAVLSVHAFGGEQFAAGPNSQPAATAPGVSAADRDATAKLAIPSEASQQQAEKQLNEVVGDRMAALRTPADRIALAVELKQTAAETSEPQVRFILLRHTRDLLIEAGDVDGAIAAQEALQKTFKIEGTPLEVSFWQRLSRAALPEDQSPKLCRGLLDAMAKAISGDRYDVARQLEYMAAPRVRRCNDKELSDRLESLTSQTVRYEAEYRQIASEAAVLTTRRDDAKANLAIGRFRCYAKGDWESGLPLLTRAASASPAAAGAAQREMARPSAPAEQAAVADAWWAVADTETAAYKPAIRMHAGYWYATAAPSLRGLTRLKAQERSAEYVKSHPATAVADAGKNGNAGGGAGAPNGAAPPAGPNAAAGDQQFTSPIQMVQALPANLLPKNGVGWTEQERNAGTNALKERVVGHQATFTVTLAQVSGENGFLRAATAPFEAGPFQLRISFAFDDEHPEKWPAIRAGGTFNVTGSVWIARFDPGLQMFVFLEDCRVLRAGEKAPSPVGGGTIRNAYSSVEEVIAALPMAILPRNDDEWADREKLTAFSKETFRRIADKRGTVTVTIQSIDMDPKRPTLKSVPIKVGSTSLIFSMAFEGNAVALADVKGGQTCTVTGEFMGPGCGSSGIFMWLHNCRMVSQKK